MRILIADDDRVAATILQRAAERQGLDSVVAHDGEQAWRILQEHPAVAIAIVDWMMPGEVKQPSGLLPICSYCKRIRSDENYWEQMESFVSEHSEAEISLGICPKCLETVSIEFGA